MTAALLCLASAILVVPTRGARERLRAIGPHPAARRSVVARGKRWALGRGMSPFDLVFPACVPLVAMGSVGPAVATAIVAATARRRHRRQLLSKRRDRERRNVLSGLDVVIAELRVGAHPAVACETAAADCDGAAAEALRCAAARARLGGSAASGFAANDSGVDDDLRRIANAWAVAEEHGLALAELLDAARSDLSGRIRFRMRAEAGLAGARATAAVLAALPVLGVVLGQMMGATPVRVLLGSALGEILLVIGTALVATGLWWTDRIVDRVVT
ncbi:type II secretion system F family protein [Rhodococcus xishaensis]|uniref:Type ii secretion system integral membrane subunit n=1 Tax=Rhodococcus xishaensis TaxID=2487364 RepID=A0A438ANV5_9NOCA|nr:type II secretion system F family protein [Rhodococcus xishaensis]RVW00282.1 type ii secretion system integral membrane subunit [Rhodococcus xishaensis]